MKKKILFLTNPLSFFISHRLEIACAAINKGYEVKVAYGELGNSNSEHIKILLNKEIECFQIPFKRGSINLFRELRSFFYIYKIIYHLKPDIVHLITTRAYIYGGIAARLAKTPCVLSAVAGLGILFSEKRLDNYFFKKIAIYIFKLAFSCKNQIIIFQNLEDRRTLEKLINLDPKNTILLKGSGVDLSKFYDLKDSTSTFTVCFASRLIKEKGVFDFISAARILKDMNIHVKFLLAGNMDLGNPNSLSNKEIDKIINEKIVEYIGYQEDIPSLFSKSHIICLPSFYGEGLPKILLEAAAASRAVVTTDTVGCRDAIIPNKSGLLVQPKEPKKLAETLKYLILNPEVRVSMGKEGRKLAEKYFSIELIVDKHLEIYRELLNKNQI